MYYKDKKSPLLNPQSMHMLRTYAKFVPIDYRRYFVYIALFVLLIYFYKLSSFVHVISSEDSSQKNAAFLNDAHEFNNFIQIQKVKDSEASSIIISALIKNEQESVPNRPIYSLVKPFVNGIYLYDMNEPIESWWPFDCIKTRMQKSINTKLCIHDPKFDKYVSGQLKQNGLWEPTNVRTFLRALAEVPDANVIDIGANIGLYTLLSAKMNRSVIAIEPLHENLNRIHKAAHMERVQSKIVALVNAVSNERKQLKLSIVDYNIGGSHVAEDDLMDEEEKFQLASSAVIVNSILLDDLVDVFKFKMPMIGKNGSKKFIMKLDIEGYEPYAFEKGENLFKKLEVVAIFMEMGKMVEKLRRIKRANYNNYLMKIKNMFRVLNELNYEPYEVNGFNKLEYSKWMQDWPWDVYFRQCDLLNCPGHTYKVSGA